MKKAILLFLSLILLVSCDKDVFTGLVESEVTIFEKVFVSSNPGGYRLFIDDKFMSVFSPDTIPFVGPGIHKLTLKHDVFSDSSLTITVEKNSPLSLSIDMMKNPRFFARVDCSSNPQGAKIYLNDLPTGLITPATLTNIYPGDVEIKFSKNQYRDDSVVTKIKGGQTSGIYRILEDTSRTVSYRTNNCNITSNLLSKVVVDGYNNKWIGSIDHGLMKFDGKKWTSYENEPAIKGSNVQDLLVDSKGNIWVATAQGLAVFDGINWQSYTDKLPSDFVTALEEDFSGNIWIATSAGLVKYFNYTFETYTRANTGYPLENLSSLSFSRNGDLWVGSSVYGFFRFNNGNWTLFDTSQKDPLSALSNKIIDLIVDGSGKLLVFHGALPFEGKLAGLSQVENGIWMFRQIPILFTLDLSSFYLDDNKNVWMSINGGLIMLNDSTYTVKVYDRDTYGFFSSQATSFCIDHAGEGWMTTKGGGLIKIKKSTF